MANTIVCNHGTLIGTLSIWGIMQELIRFCNSFCSVLLTKARLRQKTRNYIKFEIYSWLCKCFVINQLYIFYTTSWVLDRIPKKDFWKTLKFVQIAHLISGLAFGPYKWLQNLALTIVNLAYKELLSSSKRKIIENKKQNKQSTTLFFSTTLHTDNCPCKFTYLDTANHTYVSHVSHVRPKQVNL